MSDPNLTKEIIELRSRIEILEGEQAGLDEQVKNSLAYLQERLIEGEILIKALTEVCGADKVDVIVARMRREYLDREEKQEREQLETLLKAGKLVAGKAITKRSVVVGPQHEMDTEGKLTPVIPFTLVGIASLPMSVQRGCIGGGVGTRIVTGNVCLVVERIFERVNAAR